MYQPFVLRNKETLEKQVIRSSFECAIDRAVNELHRMFKQFQPTISAGTFNEKSIAEIKVITGSSDPVLFELIAV